MEVLYQMEIVDCNRAKKTTSQACDDGKTALLEFRLLNEHYADSTARYTRPHGIRKAHSGHKGHQQGHPNGRGIGDADGLGNRQVSKGIKSAEHGTGAGDAPNPKVLGGGEENERFRGDHGKGGNKEEIDERSGEDDSQPAGRSCRIMGESPH